MYTLIEKRLNPDGERQKCESFSGITKEIFVVGACIQVLLAGSVLISESTATGSFARRARHYTGHTYMCRDESAIQLARHVQVGYGALHTDLRGGMEDASAQRVQALHE
uniref:Uncharacterized protein n=1 Tax=Psilocybe cubensis TaxID=181762 RepID=A0A8H7Y4A6_PSICU